MMFEVWLVVGVVVVMVVTVVGAVLQRRYVTRSHYAGTGLQDWGRRARALPWPDRLHLERANSRGRATRPELAAIAADRGRVMIAVLERHEQLTFQRRLRVFLVAIGALQVAFTIYLLTAGESSSFTWVQLVIWSLLTLVFAVQPWQQRRQLIALRRSVAANETGRGEGRGRT